MLIRHQQDCVLGIFYIVSGAAFSMVAYSYPMGSVARMGPGFFPFYLGLLLTALGVILVVKSLARTASVTRVRKIDVDILAILVASISAFGVLMASVGMIVSTFVSVLIAGFASRSLSMRQTLICAVVLTTAATQLFVTALGLNLPLWPRAFGELLPWN